MRTTIDLPADLHTILTSLAVHQRSSLSQTASELIRRGLCAPPAAVRGAKLSTHRATGLPVLRTSRPITAADVKALEDET